MNNCRACSSNKISSVIPLGELPLANSLSINGNEEKIFKHNLEVLLCEECSLAQLKDLIDPAELFSDYVYFSSNSDAMLQSAADLTNQVIPQLNEQSLVIEIASNDGYLLKNYVEKNIPVLGIDPAENIAEIANDKGINTLCAFFGEELAKELSNNNQQADIIHANNVMAHVPDINGFIKGIKLLLKDDGIAIIEVPHLLSLVNHLEFDTIYHEHVFYFSLKSLIRAFSKSELDIFDVEKISLHGGSLRLFVSHQGKKEISLHIQNILDDEMVAGIYDIQTYNNFMSKINLLKNNLKNTIDTLKLEGHQIVAYGASAKGTTLLNYFQIGKEQLDFVVDRSKVKQGKFTPGTLLEIKCPTQLDAKKNPYALLLTWNFAEEILNQQQEYIKNGGKFIIPLPEIRVLP